MIVRNERDTCLIQVRFDKQGEPYYIIPENVSWDFIKVPLPKWELVKKYSSLYYGTLALRSRESRETLQQILQQGKFAHVLCDVNLRPPFYSAETVEFCLQHCDRAKLNEEELDMIRSILSMEAELIMATPAMSSRVRGETRRSCTLADPADCPKMVMLSGSPPKLAMFRLTHFKAATRSARPAWEECLYCSPYWDRSK